MQNYSTIEEKAAEWNVSTRHIQYLCRQGNVKGAIKRAGSWFIPEDAPIPIKNSKKKLCRKGQEFKFVGTKSKIFDCAIELFALKGFQNTSFKDLADSAGIRQSTMYHHFKSKQEILDTIYGFYCHYYINGRISMADMEKAIQEESPMEIIEKIRYEFKDEYRQRMLDITCIIWQRIGIDDRARDIAKTLIVEEGIEYVEDIFDKAVEAGRFAPFDTHVIAVFINVVRIFTLYYWIIDQSPDNRLKLSKDEWALYNLVLKFIVDVNPNQQ